MQFKVNKPTYKHSITIGSDPEFGFLLQDSRKQAYADDIINRGVNTQDGIGLDGHAHIAEIRTKNGDTCPVVHTNRIERLLRDKLLPIIKPHKLITIAGSLVGADPIGGHIHFGGLDGRVQHETMANVLDLFVAVPSLLIENNKDAVARRQQYGKLGSYRTKNHGMEYRVLPSWLVSKGYATSFLSLAYVVVDHLNCGGTLPRFNDLPAIARAYYKKGDRNFFKRYSQKLYNCIQKCRLYKQYSMPISALFGLIKAFNNTRPYKNWCPNIDIMERWHVIEKVAWKLSYNPRDFWLKQITSPFKTWLFDRPIRVYGISDAKANDLDVYINPALYGYRTEIFETRLKEKADVYIGFSKRIRVNNAEKCVSILKPLLKKYRILTTFAINKKYIKILDEESETIETETDSDYAGLEDSTSSVTETISSTIDVTPFLPANIRNLTWFRNEIFVNNDVFAENNINDGDMVRVRIQSGAQSLYRYSSRFGRLRFNERLCG